MDRDQLEFLISQYLDETIEAGDRAALEQRLATDPEARGLLEAYRRLDEVLVAGLPAVPEMNWEGLADRIGAGIDAEEEARAGRMRMRWFRSAAGAVALAASLLVAVGAFTQWGRLFDQGSTPVAGQPVGRSVLQVAVGVGVEPAAAGPAVTDVRIGPASQYADAWRQRRINEEIVTRPATVFIARGDADDFSLRF